MGVILKLLSGPLGLYALIAVAALLAASMAYGAYQHQRAERYQVAVQSKQRDLDIVMNAVTSKDAAIAKQNAALAKWKEYAEITDANQKQALEQSREDSKALLSYSQQLRAQKRTDYALPDCAKFMAADLAVLCPAHSVGLRDRASRNN